MSNRIQQALDYFLGTGNYTREQAAGIVGNLVGESNLDPRAVGDSGSSFGIAQWRGKRLDDFRRVFGKDISQSSFEEQLQFVQWELQNTEKSAYNALLGENTIAGAVRAFMKKFERPKDDSSLGARVNAANQAANGGGGSTSSSSSSIGDKITSAITPDWIERLLNGETAKRWAGVIIGIILIGLAIAAFVFSDKVKEITDV